MRQIYPKMASSSHSNENGVLLSVTVGHKIAELVTAARRNLSSLGPINPSPSGVMTFAAACAVAKYIYDAGKSVESLSPLAASREQVRKNEKMAIVSIDAVCYYFTTTTFCVPIIR
jgi:hypothetical protein